LGLAGAATAVTPAILAKDTMDTQGSKVTYLNRPAANSSGEQTLKLALIGAGGMGTEDMNTALKHDNVEMIAVCDLYDGRLDQASEKWGNHLFKTKDYKEILKRKDIDAVIIGTPDHWHKQISIDALNAGKHAYCEKPMVHSVDEGHELINAW